VNKWAHRVSLFSALGHLAIGLPELFQIGPRFLPASWVIIYEFLPDRLEWFWPMLYVVTGIFAAIGVRCPRTMKIAFLLSALINFIWGSVSLYGWTIGRGGTIPGSFTYWYLSALQFVLAYYVTFGQRVERVEKKAEELLVIIDDVEHDAA
jgi:hypothetical protein